MLTRVFLVLFSVVAFCSSPVFADTPVPNDPCGGLRQGCTPWMKEMFADFLDADDLIAQSGAYTGHCYYHANNYSNDHRHYGALLIEAGEDGKIYFNGTFSFFAQPDRYADWNLTTARERISNPWRYPMVSFGDHSMADFMPDGLWKFWLSQNPETNEILLLSYWGFFQRGFCRFMPTEMED